MRLQNISRQQLYCLLLFGFAVFGFLFFYVMSFPGYMTNDSLRQYSQAQDFVFTDWHPPVMAWWWSVLNKIFSGTQGMLFFHLLLLWSGLLIFSLQFRKESYSWLFLLIGFLPWIANFEGVLWKDVGLAYSAFLAVALLTLTPRKPFYLFMAFCLLLYAFMVRHNAFFALVPLFWLFVKVVRPQVRVLPTVLTVFLLLISFYVISNMFNYEILKAQKTHRLEYVMADDIKNVLPNENKELIDSVNKAFDLMPTGVADWSELKKVWLGTISAHPIRYLAHRFTSFGSFLTEPCYILNNTHSSVSYIKADTNNINPKVFIAKNSLVSSFIYLSVGMYPFFFAPYFWLLIGIVFAGLSLYLQGDAKIILTIRVLIVSSIFYIMGYLPVATDCDFRFAYYSVLATTLAFFLFLICKNVRLVFFSR